MPSQVPDAQLGEAVLRSVQYGAYPESEDVISAEVSASALPVILKLFEQSREDVKSEIRSLSNQAAPDIDDWISQASRLHTDIEKSGEAAGNILRQAEEEKRLHDEIQDATSKLELLIGEVRFNEALTKTLQHIYRIQTALDQVQEDALADNLVEAIERLGKAEGDVSLLQTIENATVVGLLRDRASSLRAALVENANDYWDALIEFNRAENRITMRNEFQKSPDTPLIDIHTVVDALTQLHLLKRNIDVLFTNFDSIILSPRLTLSVDRTTAAVHVNGDDIVVSGRNADDGIESLFGDLNMIIEYLSTRLPPSVSIPLSGILLPSLYARLISSWLDSSVPSSLDGMAGFQEILDLAIKLEEDVESFGWTAKRELLDWVNRAPRVWLTKRRETSLNDVRTILSKGFGTVKSVERVETQTVTHKGETFGEIGADDGWNGAWSDEDTEKQEIKPKTSTVDAEDDVSAWGLDGDVDPEVNHSTDSRPTQVEDDDEINEAWGWGDDAGDDGDETVPSPDKAKESVGNGQREKRNKERELTLKETYNITAVPESLLELIKYVVDDAETLTLPDYNSSPISPAAAGLVSLPTLILAMFRASAPFYYAQDPSGNMFLYNDSLWLGEQLRRFTEGHSQREIAASLRAVGKLNLDQDIKHLEVFGKRAYGREMESQRTILVDFLDGAQGFASCTVHPFAAECETAINSCVDRIRDIHDRWKGVLSHSALLQSIGSLLSTVTNKIIVDIEDMSDISEPDSQRLAFFCYQISKLDDLFLPERSPGSSGEAFPLTAVYTPNWLKFQYLATILEGSLADIKFLWSEGELRLEFEAQEVVDLIEALFADSEHRRKAIAEIRRSSTGR